MSHNATDVRLNITASVGAPGGVTMKVHAPCLTGTVDTIRKLGTEDIGMTETTPVVWQGGLYRFESLRGGNWNNTLGCECQGPLLRTVRGTWEGEGYPGVCRRPWLSARSSKISGETNLYVGLVPGGALP